MKDLGNLFILLLLLVVACLTSLLTTTIVLSVAGLYGLYFISSMSFLQVYGVVALLAIITSGIKRDREEDSSIASLAIRLFTRLFELLAFWGVTVLMYYIIT